MATELENLPEAGVQVTSINLHALDFERLGGAKPKEQLQLQVSLGTARPAAESLAVELSVAVDSAESFRARATYRALFKRLQPFGDEEDEVGFWRIIASKIAPLVLIPYLRMTFSHLLGEGGLQPLLIPLVNPMAMFDPVDVQIDPAPVEQAESKKSDGTATDDAGD